MEISPWVCRALAQVNPLARLAWAGRPRKTPDELNAGSYALVRLYRAQDVGPLQAPYLIQELWDVTNAADRHGKLDRRGIVRGPIFSRTGRPTRDWDEHAWVPVYVANFNDFGVSNDTIARGGFLPLMRRWMRPIKDRVLESATAAEKDLAHKTREIALDGRDYLWHLANKTGQGSNRTTIKEERVAVGKSLAERKPGFEGYYNPNKVFR